MAGDAFYVCGMSTHNVSHARLRSSLFLRRMNNVARRLLCELQQGLQPPRFHTPVTPVMMRKGVQLAEGALYLRNGMCGECLQVP